MESTNEASVNNLSEAYNQLMDDLEEDTRVRHANRLERLEEIEIRIWKDNQWLAKNKPIHEKLDREWNTLRETTKKRDKAYNDLYKKVRNLRSQIYSQEKILKNITRRRDRLLDYLVRENNRVFQKGLNNS
jgi:septal ring factor EnvC (AmiA/AmiB activator)